MFMKKLIIALVVLILGACMDADFVNEDLCTSTRCGEPIQNQVNITVYNNTSVDFEQLIWSMGGEIDTINVLAFDQFSCWKNYDTINMTYVFANGILGESSYLSDTLFFDATIADTITSGNYKLTINLVKDTKLGLDVEEGYGGECVSFQ